MRILEVVFFWRGCFQLRQEQRQRLHDSWFFAKWDISISCSFSLVGLALVLQGKGSKHIVLTFLIKIQRTCLWVKDVKSEKKKNRIRIKLWNKKVNCLLILILFVLLVNWIKLLNEIQDDRRVCIAKEFLFIFLE